MTTDPIDPNQMPLAVCLRYQLPTSAGASEVMLVSTKERIDQVIPLLDLHAPAAPAEAKPQELPAPAAEFIGLVNRLAEGLEELQALISSKGISHWDPLAGAVDGVEVPCVSIAILRELGSGPKQIARLLNCEAGFFDQGEQTICLFSPVRFMPRQGFFDMRAGA